MSLVFDASALLAQAKAEPGAAVVNELLTDLAQPRIVHAVNLCEVYYRLLRLGDEPRARLTLQELEEVELVTRTDMDPPFWRAIAHLKVDFPHASLGDCFVIALAVRVAGTIVTSDHPGFDPVAARGVCPVRFIR